MNTLIHINMLIIVINNIIDLDGRWRIRQLADYIDTSSMQINSFYTNSDGLGSLVY